MLRSLKKGYAFDLLVNRGIPFDGLGMTSLSFISTAATSLSTEHFDLGNDYFVKEADYIRGFLYVWALRVDAEGNVLDEAEKEFGKLREGFLTASKDTTEQVGLLSELK